MGYASRLVLVGLLWAMALLLSMPPHDWLTWLMEVLPVLLAWPALWQLRRSMPFSRLLLCCICLHGLILILGGMFTYARVPLGDWLQQVLVLQRNPYDRIGHFMQGAVPALLAREVLLRGEHMRRSRMLGVVALCVALAISAGYELVEWAAALLLDQGAIEFLGTQGDPWDTQWDMFMALCGALFSLGVLAGLQDRQLAGG